MDASPRFRQTRAVRSEIRVLRSDPRPVVPGPAVVPGLEVLAANNNLDVCEHDGRRYLASRAAPIHFASASARVNVVASDDGGQT
jgi:hypothetical protein